MVSRLRSALLIGPQSTRTYWKAHRLLSLQCINYLFTLWTPRTAYAATLSRCIRPLTTVNAQATAEQITYYDLDLSSIDSNFRFPEQLALSINRLWHDPVIPQIMDYHSSEFYLMDSAS